MKVATALIALVLASPMLASPARADLADLGGIKLGQKYKKAKPRKVTLYGCSGKLYGAAKAKGSKVVDEVGFETDKCSDTATADAITKDFGAAPIVNFQGDFLWEGTTGSVILFKMAGLDGFVLHLVKPQPDGKRICWSKDGFAEFWAAFVKAAAAGKPAVAAASFVFPFKDEDGNFEIKTAKEMETRWADLFSADDIKDMVAGGMNRVCDQFDLRYQVFVHAPNADLYATRAADGTWKWTSIALESTD